MDSEEINALIDFHVQQAMIQVNHVFMLTVMLS